MQIEKIIKGMNEKHVTRYFKIEERKERLRSVRELEMMFFEILGSLDVDLFIEAGAKDAGTSIKVAKEKLAKKIVAFEANPYTHKRFSKIHKYKDMGVDYRHLALCDFKGKINMNVRKREDGLAHADGQASILKNPDYKPGHIQETVPSTTLDSVVNEFKADNFAMWMDVEGASEVVLKGCEKSFSKMLVAFVEVETQEIWSSQWLKKDVNDYLLQFGLVPFARDYQNKKQHNIIYLPEQVVKEGFIRIAAKNYNKRVTKSVSLR